MANPGNNGRVFYMRKYESTADAEHNASGKPGRARSGSMGQMDASGNRFERLHFHAIGGQHTLVTSRGDAGPHSKSELKGEISISTRPMMIPGAVKHGAVEGVERKY
jgi:hypothetical protein